MRMSPAVMSSSPTIMRSNVDLPQPDGPTRIMNSPSSISSSTSFTASVPSGNVRLTWSMRMLAIARSPLYCTGREPGDDAALEDQHHDDDRNRDDDRGGGDGTGRLLELGVAVEERDRRRRGAG